MPGPRRRLRPLLIAAAVTGAVLAASPAIAATERSGAPAVTASPLAKAPTSLHGWAASPRTVKAGHRLVVEVRATGAERVVRLERRLHGEWRLVDRAREGAKGTAVLHWRAATTQQRAVLRVRVPATASHRAASSRVHRIAVVQPATAATPSTSPAPTTSPSTTSPSSTSAPSAEEALRARLLVLVNQARAAARTCGSTAYPAVRALVRSTPLDTAAGDYAVRMATEHFFSHTSPDGTTMVSRMNAVGVRNVAMRENIAAGYATADAVMDGWLQSPGHCANLMAADVTRIGLGHASGSGSYFTDTWVQDFAG